MTIKIYEVGGSVRDKFLGLNPKDFDFSVEAPSFAAMSSFITNTHDKVFLEKEEFLTIRAMKGKEIFDYVMCRKDGTYSDARHPDKVIPGTIIDDLSRRDFTINAMAIDHDTGETIDPFNGREDLKNKILRCVGSTRDRFSEDPLRVIRAIRFCITKEFVPSNEIKDVFLGLDEDEDWPNKILSSVSIDRIREELIKCFKFDTEATMKFFILNLSSKYCLLFRETDLWLKPTTEKK
jgi:tRNA nucleotidyltransferase/poly(A) polymerase